MSTGSISLPASLGGTLVPWMANPAVPAETASPFKGEPVTKPRTMDDPGRRSLTTRSLPARKRGDAAAFDELVIKYSPRLYGLVYNMTSNHEDTNDPAAGCLGEGVSLDQRVPNAVELLYPGCTLIAVNMSINFLKKRGRRHLMSLDDVDSGIQNDKEFIELTASSNPVREADLLRAAEAAQRRSDA